MNKTPYTSITVKDLGNAEVLITGDITLEAVQKHRPAVIKKLQQNTEMAGFRKGHVPEKHIVERVGEPTVLGDVAELVLQSAYPRIIKEQNVNAIGRPEVTLTKLAPDNPIGFSIKTAVLPTFDLPDYRAIAKNVLAKTRTDFSATEEEIDTVIKNIRQNYERAQENKEGPKDPPMPDPLTDDFVKTLGEFTSVADFRNKLEQGLTEDKRRKEKEKNRVAIGDEIVAQTKITLPRVLVEHELSLMLSQFKADIERMKLTFEDYLAKIGKSEDDVRKGFEEDAKKRALLQLVLNAIAEKENVVPDKERVEREVSHILSHIKDANTENVRFYVETMLRNEAVFTLLEGVTNGEK